MPDNDTKLEQLKQKYAPVFAQLEQQRISLSNVRLQDGKILIRGVAPTDQARTRVTEQLRSVNPRWEQEVECDLRTETDQPAGPESGANVVNTSQDFSTENHVHNRRYTVRSGDTLKTISHQFYGTEDEVGRILEANRDKLQNGDSVTEGQVLTIPAA